MIISFSVENYLSFKERVTLDFTAKSIKEKTENTFSPFFFEGPNLLKSVGVYGKNSSGKSNIINAFSFMRNFVISSSKESQIAEEIKVQPFRLSTTSENDSSLFETIFFIEETKYRYGFSVTKNTVISEWLFHTQKRKESYLFIRAGKGFDYDKKLKQDLKGKIELFVELTRTNSLFISVLSQFNVDLAVNITTWFNRILVAHDIDHLALIDFSARLMTDEYYNRKLNEVIKKSDLGIESLEQKLKDIISKKNYSTEFLKSVFKADVKDYTIRTSHMKYDEEKNPHQKIFFELVEQESLGTQKYFGLFGPILLALTERRILFIDEIDARLHPILLENIISFFNSKRYNPNGAQIIFTSHNTLPLRKLLRRDQMFFVDKDDFGVSHVDSLYNKVPSVRNDASYDKDYLSGKYGAIPRLNLQLNLFNEENKLQDE